MNPLGVLAFGYQANWWDVLQADFMRNALLGGTLVAVTGGIVGYFVVVRRLPFAAHTLAHIGFPGATGAVLVGVPVTLGLTVFCVGGALVIGVLGRRVDDREVATGTVLAAATGLGVLFSSLATAQVGLVTSVLFGNLLAISSGQLVTFACFTAGLLAVLVVVGRPLLYASIEPDVAAARGLPVRLLEVAFLVVMALAVTMAVQVVGTLLLFALLVTPGAIAIVVTPRPGPALAVSTGVSVAAVWAGVVLGVMFDLPVTFFIVALIVVAWAVTLPITRRRRRPVVPGASVPVLEAVEVPVGG